MSLAGQWREGGLLFDFSQAAWSAKFDDPAWHGVTHLGLRAVDFLVEWPDQLWLIEVKDPEQAPPLQREQAVKRFSGTLHSGRLIGEQLAPKLRDSLFYLWLENWDLQRPIRYWVVLGLSNLNPTSLLGLRNAFAKTTWYSALHQRGWRQKLDLDIQFFTVNTWQRHVPQCPLQRINPL